jgi:type 1 fimbria pilin
MRRILQILVVAAIGVATVVTGGVAHAKENPNGSISVSPSTISPGGTVHISGSVSIQGCPQSDDATVTGPSALFPPDGFGPTVPRDSNGDFATDYTVPTSTPPGTYVLTVRCGGGNVGVSAQLQVISAPSGAPQTGMGGAEHRSSVPWTPIGVGFVVLAGALVGFRRKLARWIA